MRNKRTLQRGLSLLLAGGMALSSVGVTPVLAEEYTPAPETTQATPETAAQAPDDAALTEDDLVPAEEAQAEPATQQADEASPIAVQADEQTEDDGLTPLIDEDFENTTGNFGFSDNTVAIKDGALELTNKTSRATSIKKFDQVVAGQSKIQLSFDWTPHLPTKNVKAGMEFRDTYGRLLFAIHGCYKNGSYELRYSTTGKASVSAKCADDIDPTWVYGTPLSNNATYKVNATADFENHTLQLQITDSTGNAIVDLKDQPIDANNLAKMVSCDFYSEATATQTVDNFKLYGSNDAGEFPLEGKSIVAFGDSIVAGHKYEAASFVDFVAQKEGMNVQKKYAINGASIMEYNSYGGMILTKQINNADANLAPDYVIFDGGTNDAEYLVNNQDKFGDVDSTDTTTFAGAFRATIKALKEKYPSAKLVYVAVHKLGARDADVQAKLHELELAICKDMGVNVSNIYDDTKLDTSDADMKAKYSFDSLSNAGVPQSGTDGNGTGATGTHPNFAAIEEFYVPTVSATLRTAQDTTPDPVEPDEPDDQTGISIDFADVEDLNADLHGWTYTNGVGTVELVNDEEKGNVLKMSHLVNGNETALIYDGLDIQESDYRYVTVTAEMKLDSASYAHQYSIPYIFNSAGDVVYTLFTNESATKYQTHVNGKNVTDAGTLKTNTWQTVSMNIDMQSDTFSVSVDGTTTLRNAIARKATDNLQKIKFYADSWNHGTLYIKSVDVTVSNENPVKVHEKAATYYVSNNGDDSKDGLTPETAWKTIARVNQDTYIPGDKILFERGGKWENTTLQPQGSGTADAYITIGAYGDETAHKPRISANGKVADALYLYNQEYWEICDLDISNNVEGTTMVAGDTNPTSNVVDRVASEGEKLGDYRGIHIAGHDVATLQGYYIHDVRVHDVSGIVSWIGNTGKNEPGIGNNYGYDKSKRTGGILIEAIAPTGDTDVKTGQPTVFSNITIENSEFVNNSFCGITIKQYNNGKNQENGTGWANRNSNNGAPDYYDQYWHPFTNIVIRGNYINQGASAYACNGMYLCGVKDSVVEKNLMENIGTCGIELFFADNVAVQYNDISNVRWKGGGQDANAIDPDWRATNILIQYNYIHDCGEGLLLCGMRCNSGTIRYNLIQDCTSSYIHYSMGGGYFQINNNVFYRSKDGYGTSNFDPWGNGTASYVNNIFYDGKGTGFGFSSGSTFSYYNNAYYGTPACSKDTNPIVLTEDPFEGTAPDMKRVGTSATGVLLEANGLIPKISSGLVAAGANKDANGIALTEGMTGKGSKLNYTSLIAAYGDIVPTVATAYPVFEKTGTDATLSTNYTQTAADATTPTIGLFERVLTDEDIILNGTVTDGISVYPNAAVTVTVGEKTLKTTTDANGNFRLTNKDGLVAGEATVTAVVDGENYKATVTLKGGESQTVTVKLPLPQMPDPYPVEVLNENFDDNKSDVFKFGKGAKFENGQLVLTNMGNAVASVSNFSDEIKALDAVDFSFDYKYDNSNKAGFEFRDDKGALLFAMCIAATKGQMRYSTTGDVLTDDAKAASAAEPTWSYVTSDTSKTYVVRVHADFTTGKVSYQIREKDTDKIVVQQLDATTDAKNLAKMNICSWWDAKPQYIDNFVLTTPDKKSEPVVANKEALQQAIEANADKVEDDYTETSWADFAKALADAKDIFDKADATQAEVDAATEALTKAADALETKPAPVVVNKDALKQAIDAATDKVEEDYTETSWADFAKALADAKDVFDKADATQAEVDAATEALTKAAAALETKPAPVVVNKDALKQAIDAAADKVEEDYTETSWADFAKALADAKDVFDKADATQEEVDAATDALTKAAEALETKPAPVVVNKDALKQAIEANGDKVEGYYTETSWTNFAKALADAKDIFDKADATQEEVDAATAALTDAAKKLETKPAPVEVNKEALQQAIEANADKVEEDYTETSWADFAKALADAKDVFDKADATQAEVDAATKALTDAAAALKVKPTEPPKPDTVTKVDNEPLSDKNIPDSLKEAGYDTPEKIENKLKQESSQEFASDNLVVYDVTLKVSTDGGKTWQKATEENFPKDGLEVSFDLPEGITAETADQYTFLISHMKDDATVELLTPVLKDGKLTVTVKSLSPFGISWKAKEQPKPTEQPTATPAPTAKPSNSSTTPKATAAPKATDAPKATAAPAAPIPQTADSFPLVMLAVLALCSAAALAGLTICRSKKKH